MTRGHPPDGRIGRRCRRHSLSRMAGSRNSRAARSDGPAPAGSTFAGLAVGGLAAVAVTTAITLSGVSTRLQATARASTVGVPIAVGLYAMRHAASARFGSLRGWSASAGSSRRSQSRRRRGCPSAGRVAGSVVEVSLIYLILAFPSGRLPGAHGPKPRRGGGPYSSSRSTCRPRGWSSSIRSRARGRTAAGLPGERVHGRRERARADRGGRGPAA